MKLIKFSALAATLILIGCVDAERIHQEYLAENAEMPAVKESLIVAQKNAVFDCSNKRDCDKAFLLTKSYVQTNTDYKIQFSDDTMIATYNGVFNHSYRCDNQTCSMVSLKATKTLGAGDTATIDLIASCPGLQETYDGRTFNQCARKLITIYDGFKPYIETKLK
jgi:hypothetical protein